MSWKLLASLLVTATSCALVSSGAPVRPVSHPVPAYQAAADHTEDKVRSVSRTIEVGSRTRSYLLDIPRAAEGDNPGSYPLILAFGGKDVTPRRFAKDSGLEQASHGRAIVVYPQGLKNRWENAPYAHSSRGEDVRFVREIIKELSADYPVDQNRIMAVGHSNGGGMVGAILCQDPGLIDAAMTVAGAFYEGTFSGCATAHPVPIAMLHSTDDTVINYEGGVKWGEPLGSAREAFEEIARRNGCNTHVIAARDIGPNAVRYRPTGCDALTSLTKVEGEGHSWYDEPNVPDVAWNVLNGRDSH
ncbi:alpha/beta hydrolase family esterase [Corynebacterium tapiri]|uniref:alpha/beta hydrolase family esterase n=1 Tax=Corynebacterium tapiri TaxID=1448266 RepID=UPI0015D605AF|nr:prolyl oligopeptidase family serine peptidase [Corynebacterium tapiri]